MEDNRPIYNRFFAEILIGFLILVFAGLYHVRPDQVTGNNLSTLIGVLGGMVYGANKRNSPQTINAPIKNAEIDVTRSDT